ncbi:MAG: hypothetical protein JWN86_717 [Planctomycetota bacterium]|nr:hypothetical protein [Planctomycetota bacterium]
MIDAQVDVPTIPPPVPAGPRPPRRPPAAQAAGLGEQLRRAIGETGLSARAVADAAGVDPRVVSRFLAGQRDLYLDTAAKIAAYLNLRLVESARPRRR